MYIPLASGWASALTSKMPCNQHGRIILLPALYRQSVPIGITQLTASHTIQYAGRRIAQSTNVAYAVVSAAATP
jgi:hypothetical protein